MLPDGGRSTSEDMWSRKRHFGTACNVQRCRYWGQFRNHVHDFISTCHKQGRLRPDEAEDSRNNNNNSNNNENNNNEGLVF